MELPPITESTDKENPSPKQADQGISKGLKISIIAFTVFTLIALIVFTVMLANRLSSPKIKTGGWNTQMLTVGEKLKDAGLPEQAIEQYEKYLRGPKVGLVVRGEVSRTLGNLYRDLGNCPEALSWYYQAEAAFPKAPWLEELNVEIDGCLNNLQNPE
jgi:hypothetical protein